MEKKIAHAKELLEESLDVIESCNAKLIWFISDADPEVNREAILKVKREVESLINDLETETFLSDKDYNGICTLTGVFIPMMLERVTARAERDKATTLRSLEFYREQLRKDDTLLLALALQHVDFVEQLVAAIKELKRDCYPLITLDKEFKYGLLTLTRLLKERQESNND